MLSEMRQVVASLCGAELADGWPYYIRGVVMVGIARTGCARRPWLLFLMILLSVSVILGGLPAGAQEIDSSRAASGSIVLSLPDLGAPEIRSTESGDVALLPEMALNPAPGEPQLPATVWRVLLPHDAVLESVHVELVDAAWTELDGNYRVAPASAVVASDEEGSIAWGSYAPQELRDGRATAIYEHDAFWPAYPIAVSSVGSQRDWRVLELVYWPLAYNPVRGVLRQLTGGTVQVTFQRSGVAVSLDAASEAAWAALSPSLLNPADRALYSIADRTPAAAPDDEGVTASAVNDYVIITTSAIVANSTQLSAFVAAKQQAGLSVKVVTEGSSATASTYLSGASAVERANNIRDWLASHYASEGIQHVLLIGNPSISSFDSGISVPMRATKPYNTVATDMFYSDLSGNWDLNGNGAYGEIGDIGAGGIDRLPEVYVGRVPFYGSYAELDSILAKFVAYQGAGGDLSWRQRALIAVAISNHGPQDNDNDGVVDASDFDLAERTYGDDWGEDLAAMAQGAGMQSYTLYEKEGVYADGSAYPLTQANAALNTSNMVSAWQQGYGIVTWWAHGSTSGAYRRVWIHDATIADHITQHSQETQTPSFFTTSEVGQLDNDRPSFVLQVACTNGYPEQSTNLGYRLLVNGAVGTISSSYLSYYTAGAWPPYDLYGLGDNATMAYMVVDRMANYAEAAGVGVAYYRANAALYGVPQYWQNMLVANLYGDPTLGLASAGIGCSIAPPAPASPAPEDGAMGVDPNTELAWSGGAGCEGETVTFDVYLRADGAPDALVCADTETMACTPGLLQEGTTYRWHVVAKGLGGTTDSGEWTFTTSETPCVLSPTEPYDPSPADGETGVALDAQLTWCGGHPCSGEDVTYDVYLEANTVEPPSELVCSGVVAATCDPGPLQAGTQYAWQVVAVGLNGPTLGPVWTFDTAACTIPEPVMLDSPGAGAAITSSGPITLAWQPAEEARRYQIQVARDGAFEELVVNQDTDETSLTLGSTLRNGDYYWRVRVVASTSGCTVEGVWSEARSLQVDSAYRAFVLFAPLTKK